MVRLRQRLEANDLPRSNRVGLDWRSCDDNDACRDDNLHDRGNDNDNSKRTNESAVCERRFRSWMGREQFNRIFDFSGFVGVPSERTRVVERAFEFETAIGELRIAAHYRPNDACDLGGPGMGRQHRPGKCPRSIPGRRARWLSPGVHPLGADQSECLSVWCVVPSPGRVDAVHFPGGLGVRIDSALYSGYRIPPYYDSLIGKLIVFGKTRAECLMRLRRALSEFVVEGVDTTIPLFQKLLRENDIIDGKYDIHWLEKYLARDAAS